MFSRNNFVLMPHEGWMKIDSSFAQKWIKIVAMFLVVYMHYHL